MSDDIVLGVRNLHVTFGRRPVIDNATLELRAGDKVIIHGESGCGKSTLLNTLIGNLAPAHVRAGQFTTGDEKFEDYRRFRRESTVFRSISVVFQDAMHGLHPFRPVIDQIYSVSGDQCGRWFEKINMPLDRFDNKNRPVYQKHCSGGELQRMSLIFPMALSRPIVFLDEPLTDIDLVSRGMVIRTLGTILENPSTTVVLVSHNDDWVPSNFRRLVIEQGVLTRLRNAAYPMDSAQKGRQVRSVAIKPARTGESTPVLKVIIRKAISLSPAFRLWPTKEFTIGPGDRVGIFGESGSGKSTFLRLVAGLFDSSYGASEVLLRNQNGQLNSIHRIGVRERARRVQLVLQDTTGTLFGSQPVGENFKDIRRQTRASRAAFDTTFREWGDRLGLIDAAGGFDELLRRQLDQFSIGQRRRLSLLRALLSFDTFGEDTQRIDKVLLLDEITRGLDAKNREYLCDMLDEILERHNIALVSVSHDLSFLRSTCNTYRLMLDGALLPRHLSNSDVDTLVTNGRIDGLKNPYYGDFFSQIEPTRHPQPRTGPGCLLERRAQCKVLQAEGCYYHDELVNTGKVGICS